MKLRSILVGLVVGILIGGSSLYAKEPGPEIEINGNDAVDKDIQPQPSGIPRIISFQGILKDSAGNPVADREYRMIFKLYTQATGGRAIWTEVRDGVNKVKVEDGVYNVLLGKYASLKNVAFDKPYWLEVTVDGDVLEPRYELASSPYALGVPKLNECLWKKSDRIDKSITPKNVDWNIQLQGGYPTLFLESYGWNPNRPTNAPVIYMNSAAGGINNPQPVPKGRCLGVIVADGYTTTNKWERSIGIGFEAEADFRPNYHPASIKFCTHDTKPAWEPEALRMIIKSNGNVGIGTPEPKTDLEVRGNIWQKGFGTGDGQAPNHILHFARGNSSSPTVVSKGDDLAWIAGSGYDGDNFETAAAILMEVDGSPSTDVMPGRITFQTRSDNGGLQRRMIIDKDGNIGIGWWPSDFTKLYVSTDSDSQQQIDTAITGLISNGRFPPSGNTVIGVRGIGISGDSGDYYGGYFDTWEWVPGPSGIRVGVYAHGGVCMGFNFTTDYGIYARGDEYAGYFVGDLAATGVKSAAVKIDDEYKMLYCVESPEVWFEDFGSAQLSNGRALINLDPTFLKAVIIDSNNPMKVFVQLNGECNGVYVKKESDNFEVIELNGGTSNVSFDYRIVAKRKGYENYRFKKMLGPTPEEMEAKQAKYRRNIKKLKEQLNIEVER